MREIIRENPLYDCSWDVDDLTDMQIIHIYKSYYEEVE